MNLKKIKMEEFPYEKMEKVGLTRQMVEDLPPDTLNKLQLGQLSPLLPLTVTGPDGTKYTNFAKLHFEEKDGGVQLRIHPLLPELGDTMLVKRLDETGREKVMEVSSSDLYSAGVLAKLKQGRVVEDYLYLPDGTKQKAYLQMDEDTHEIVGVASGAIANNLQKIATDFRLTNNERQCLEKGELLTIVEEDEPITLGIDVMSPAGVRLMAGDQHQWMEGRKRDWDKYELGFNGCWMTDDDGNVQYVDEEDFDKFDIWNEVDRQRERKMQEGLRR